MSNQKSWSHTLGATLVVLLLSACGGGLSREISETRYIPASSGAPEVVRVVDLGDMSFVPAQGLVPTDRSDGMFVIGELILVEGEDFGKLPTISIGGRPAERMARTKSGGIITRIPVEVDAGTVRVEVSHPEGQHSIEMLVHRHLAVADGTAIQMVAVGGTAGMKKTGALPGRDTVDLEFGHDGQALYVLGQEKLSVVGVAAKGGPVVKEKKAIQHRAPHALVTRSGVPVLALLHSAGITFFDTRVPTSISESGRTTLPEGAAAATFSPDGKYLAVISVKGNALSLIRLGDSPAIVTRLELLAGEPVPLLRDLAFSPSGDEIWILTGNSSASIAAGSHPTQVLIVSVTSEDLSFSRSAKIGVAQAPLQLVTSQRRAIMAAAAVRSTRQRAAMVLSAVPNILLSPNPQAKDAQGQLLSFDLDGNATVLATGDAIYSQMRLSHKQDRVYAGTRMLKAGKRSLGITSASLVDSDTQYLHLADEVEGNLLKTIPLAIAP